MRPVTWLLALVLATSAVGCGRAEGTRARAVAAAEPEAPRPPPAPAPAPSPAPLPLEVTRVRVPGDMPAVVVNGETPAPPSIVFLPGICSNVLGYVQSIQATAHAHGGLVGLDGDQPCGDSKVFRSFAWDATRLHGRIEAALAAAGRTEIPREGLVLVGYSQGAALGEQLVARWPERYARVVLIGAPTEPSAASFSRARAVATMSCQRDVPWKMKEASARVARTRVPSAYFEMPGCTHGMMGDAERVFEETFAWLDASAKPVPEAASAAPITGPAPGG